jgi:hypothetical protein
MRTHAQPFRIFHFARANLCATPTLGCCHPCERERRENKGLRLECAFECNGIATPAPQWRVIGTGSTTHVVACTCAQINSPRSVTTQPGNVLRGFAAWCTVHQTWPRTRPRVLRKGLAFPLHHPCSTAGNRRTAISRTRSTSRLHFPLATYRIRNTAPSQ